MALGIGALCLFIVARTAEMKPALGQTLIVAGKQFQAPAQLTAPTFTHKPQVKLHQNIMRSENVKSQAKAQLEAIVAMGQAVKEAGSIPSGHVYAACMNIMDLETYEKCIGYLIGAGLIRKDVSHVLHWIG